MTQMQREQLSVGQEKAILAGTLFPDFTGDPHDPLSELRSLADTAGAIIIDEVIQKRQKPEPATFMGKGKVREIGERVKIHKAGVVIFDNDLTPRQIANIEEIVEAKVLDRSELILDIFAARAQTTESRLQVELAQLEYTYPRLRAMWSHLERITGGAPTGIGTRGPGEQQIEIDRRIVQRKKSQLKEEIASIQGRKTRQVEHRNQDFFSVCLVGYTNAGKSTLFNTLSSEGGAYADNKLFATLSTRTSKWSLGSGDDVMLSDTVGFVRDLPHHLVASFKATLEEAVHAHLLLVVIDVANPRCLHQYKTVIDVLDEIGANRQPRLLVLNQIDRLQHNADLLVFEKDHPDHVAVSAKTGRNLDGLAERVREFAKGEILDCTLTIDLADGKAMQFIENRSDVRDRQYNGQSAILKVRIGSRQLDQLKTLSQHLLVDGQQPRSKPQGWNIE